MMLHSPKPGAPYNKRAAEKNRTFEAIRCRVPEGTGAFVVLSGRRKYRTEVTHYDGDDLHDALACCRVAQGRRVVRRFDGAILAWSMDARSKALPEADE